MNIAELSKEKRGTSIKISGIISKAVSASKADGSIYYDLSLMDESGSISIPLWQTTYCGDFFPWKELEDGNEIVGTMVSVDGMLWDWNGSLQVKNPSFTLLKDANVNDYIPSYDISDEAKTDFEEIIRYNRYSNLIDAVLSEIGISNFMACPAAVSHHHNKLGGLFVHTYGMVRTYMSLPFDVLLISKEREKKFDEEVNNDRLVCKIILHDVAKVKEYDFPIISRKNIPMDHVAMGAMIVYSVYNKSDSLKKEFTEDEINNICYGILCHHGPYAPYKIKTKEDNILYFLDDMNAKMEEGL